MFIKNVDCSDKVSFSEFFTRDAIIKHIDIEDRVELDLWESCSSIRSQEIGELSVRI